jgi:drug/metabolite transporter (DMT)-like permease
VVLSYSACAFIWGTTYFAIRACIGPAGYPTILAAALRFVLAAIVLAGVVFLFRLKPRPDRRQTAWLLGAGLLNFCGYALVYTAEESIPGGLAAVVYGTAPLITALVAGATRIEKISMSSVVGALISLAGIVVIGWERMHVEASQAAAVLMVLGSVLMSSIYNIIFKRETSGVQPVASTAVFLTSTAAAMSLYALVVEGKPVPWPPPAGPTLALLYLAIVGSVIAFGSFLYLVQHVKLMTLSTLALWPPIVALAVDALWEAQKIAPLTYLGAAITISGLAASLFRGSGDESAPSESS